VRPAESGAGLTSRDAPNPVSFGRNNRAGDAGAPRVCLHIGEPKTGTSYLQSSLWSNRARLAAQGVVLPGYSHQDHNRASRDAREAPRPPSDPADPWVGEWDVLIGQALRARGTAVISDEILAACNPRQAARALRSLESAEVDIILTVRDFASLLPAEWQESVKCRGTAPWEQWLDSVIDAEPAADRRRRSWFWTVHDTLATLGMWSRNIPPDHVHVITVPPHGPPDLLWARFASVLGIDPGCIDLTAARVNPSLGLPEAEFLRRFNMALPEDVPYWFYTRDIKRILALDLLPSRPCQLRLTLPPDRRDWAREQSKVLAAGLRDAKYDIVGDLDELLPEPETGPYVGPADQPPAQLTDAAVEAAAALMHRLYLEKSHPIKRWQSPGGPRQAVSQLKWLLLNGPWTRRVLRDASHLAAVRRLRVVIWRVLVRPARHRR
jgi:hypothetical protein